MSKRYYILSLLRYILLILFILFLLILVIKEYQVKIPNIKKTIKVTHKCSSTNNYIIIVNKIKDKKISFFNFKKRKSKIKKVRYQQRACYLGSFLLQKEEVMQVSKRYYTLSILLLIVLILFLLVLLIFVIKKDIQQLTKYLKTNQGDYKSLNKIIS